MSTKFLFSHGNAAVVVKKLLDRIEERCVGIPIQENASLIENLESILWYHVNIRILGPDIFEDEKNQKDREFEELYRIASTLKWDPIPLEEYNDDGTPL